jgi:RNA polymerase sigma-70 factor (ECF subfamily)
MDQAQWLAEQFEANRSHLQSVAYRMLGSLTEANDAVQETWLRLSRSETDDVENLAGWLTTVVARICLDMLRLRKAQPEAPLEVPENFAPREGRPDPEQEILLADSVGVALLVVLNTLTPAERLAFVLHDIFAMPFEEIAQVIERSEAATRKLASRARRRVQGVTVEQDAQIADQRAVVEAFLTASREGSFEALLAVLDPDVVLHSDARVVAAAGSAPRVQGAAAVSKQFNGRAFGARPAIVDGAVGVIVARQGRLFLVLKPTIRDGKIVEIDVIGDPARLRQLRISILGR